MLSRRDCAMKQLEPSPLPWRQEHRECADTNYRTQVIDALGCEVATLAWNPVRGNWIIITNRAENAALIVRACNSHAALVDALESCIDECERSCIGNVALMRAALTAATEDQ